MRAKPFDLGIQSTGPTLDVFLLSQAPGAEKEAITSTYMRSMESKCTKSYMSFLPHGYTHDNFKHGSDNLGFKLGLCHSISTVHLKIFQVRDAAFYGVGSVKLLNL